MAQASSYPLGTPKITDTLVGVQYELMKDPAVKNFTITDIAALVQIENIPTPTLQEVTEESANTTVQMQINGVDVATVDDVPTPTYKVYTALLTQTGTDSPTAVVLENTIGGIFQWVRYNIPGTGFYNVNVTGLGNSVFDSNKVTILVQPNKYRFNNYSTQIIANVASGTGIQLITILLDPTSTLTDGLLNNTFIEIRVYN